MLSPYILKWLQSLREALPWTTLHAALLLLCCCSAAGSPVTKNQFLNKKKATFFSWIQNASVNCEKYSTCMWSVRMHECRQIYLFYFTFYSVWNRWLPLHNDRFEVNVIIIFRFSWAAPQIHTDSYLRPRCQAWREIWSRHLLTSSASAFSRHQPVTFIIQLTFNDLQINVTER